MRSATHTHMNKHTAEGRFRADGESDDKNAREGIERMRSAKTRSVISEGKTITYQLERKSVKNLNLRIRSDGSVTVSANSHVPVSEIDAFVRRKASFVFKAISRFEEIARHRPQPKQFVSGDMFYILGRPLTLRVSQAPKNAITSDGTFINLAVRDTQDIAAKRRLISRFLDQQCEAIFRAIVGELSPLFSRFGVREPSFRIRNMKTRWGTCQTGKGIITLNKRLLEAPAHCIEYVVMHELCHFVHPNHSKQFYSLLTSLMPDWKERKSLLEK